MHLTDEQGKILADFQEGKSLQVTAGAGTGKTTTLVGLASTCPYTRALYLAFNKAVQEEAAAKFARNTRCSTIHALAYRAIGHHYRDRLRAPRIPHWKTAKILGIHHAENLGAATLQPARLAALATETVTRYANSADETITAIHVPDVLGVAIEHRARLADIVVSAAGRMWEDMRDTRGGQLRTSHDVYLKVWALTQPDLGAEVILFDEAQDTTGVTAKVVAEQQARGARLVVVGDRAQAIYGWRGAIDAMDQFATDTQLQLSQSFRFGSRIATIANTWLAYLGQELRLSGLPQITSTIGISATPDAVLCRSNAGVMTEVIDAQARGRSAAVVGGVNDLTYLISAASDLMAAKPTNHPDLAAFTSWGEVEEYAESGDAHDLRTLVTLLGDRSPEELLNALTQTVPEGRPGAVTLSTVHKAKGREWRNVRIAPDFRAPQLGDPDPQAADEAMLAYVAVTRARAHLDPGHLTGPELPQRHRPLHSPGPAPTAARRG